ncbi:hypothetical protein ACFE04_022478 [Oxalis oulophora]
MASAVLANHNETDWPRRNGGGRGGGGGGAKFMGKVPFSNTKNPNPKFSKKRHFNQTVVNNFNNEDIDEALIVTQSGASDDASSINRKPIGRGQGGEFSGRGGYVNFGISSYSKKQLAELKNQLVMELEEIRALQGRIESHQIVNRSNKKSNLKKFNGNNKRPLQQPLPNPENATLMKNCGQILTKLMKHKFGYIFNTPVDVVGMNLHDYYDIIKRPMDLGTVKMNLSKGLYESPLDFAADVRLTFNNAMMYNPKGHHVYNLGEQLSAKFEELYRPLGQKVRTVEEIVEMEEDHHDQEEEDHRDRFVEVHHDHRMEEVHHNHRMEEVHHNHRMEEVHHNHRMEEVHHNHLMEEVHDDPIEEDHHHDRNYDEELQTSSWNRVEPTIQRVIKEIENNNEIMMIEAQSDPFQGQVASGSNPDQPSAAPIRTPSPSPVKVPYVKSVKQPKPKAKDPNKREMTMEEKHKLGLGLQSLPQEKMDNVVQIIRKRNGHLRQDGDEIELDIEAVDTETLWELDRFVTNYKKLMSKIKRQALMGINVAGNDDIGDLLPISERIEVSMEVKKPKKGEIGEEDVDIGDEMPMSSFPPVEIEKDNGHASSSSSGSSSSSSGSSSSSDSDSGSSSGSGSDEDDARS